MKIQNNCYRTDTHIPSFCRSYTIGDRFNYKGDVIRFIKVTPKGFNFLNETSNHCILTTHLYAKGYGGIEIPPHKTRFFFPRIPVALMSATLIELNNQ